MDKITTWLIRGAAGTFILVALNSVINSSAKFSQIGPFNSTPNSCPIGFAYSGNGYCRAVKCILRSGKNNPDLGGKDYACGNADFWATGWIGRLPLEWGEATVKATFDSKCPAKPPSVGWRSSCTEELGEALEPHILGGVRR